METLLDMIHNSRRSDDVYIVKLLRYKFPDVFKYTKDHYILSYVKSVLEELSKESEEKT